MSLRSSKIGTLLFASNNQRMFVEAAAIEVSLQPRWGAEALEITARGVALSPATPPVPDDIGLALARAARGFGPDCVRATVAALLPPDLSGLQRQLILAAVSGDMVAALALTDQALEAVGR